MRNLYILLIISLFAAGVFLQGVSSQSESKSGIEVAKQTEKTVTVHTKKRGLPHISFDDGIELKQLSGENQDSAFQPNLLTSADFDSDGTPDLVTADKSGNLKLYRGSENARWVNDEAQKNETSEPFELTSKNFSLNVSSDFLAAGDFNADGHQDILTAAKSANFITFVSGDGQGNFSQPQAIQFEGSLTAFSTGEIGRADGQTDLAIAVITKKGAQILIFEHPEGAFKYKPEIVRLPAAANEIAIGSLDDDSYADIAVASNNKLTLIQGRGQAYPWDLLEEYDVKRPTAKTQTRILPSRIAALAIGKFTEKRGNSLAILTASGSLQTLESPSIKKTPSLRRDSSKSNASSLDFVPSEFDASRYAVVKGDLPKDAETAEKLGLLLLDTSEDKEKLVL
jgi:hypothetical protein